MSGSHEGATADTRTVAHARTEAGTPMLSPCPRAFMATALTGSD